MAVQARNFGGGATGDILTSGSTLQFSQLISMYCRFNVNSSDATNRRLVSWLDGTRGLAEITIISGVLNFFVYSPDVWSTGLGQWQMTAPSLSTEHDLLITYDAGATGNTPIAYLDGASVTVTTVTAPTGTSTFTNAATVSIGNRSTAANRAFDGWEDIVAIWRGTILSAANDTSLHNGSAPCTLSPSFYAPLDNGDSPETELVLSNNLTVTGTTVVTGSTIVTNPRCVVTVFPKRTTIKLQAVNRGTY